MQADRRTLCAHGFASSDNDFTIARDYRARLPSAACFHARQGGETAGKGFLVMVCGDAPRNHLASVLVDELLANDVALAPEVIAATKNLDKCYAPPGVPDSLGGGNPDSAFVERDAALAIEAADLAATFARATIDEIRRSP